MAFAYYSPLTIQAGQVPGTETDFPILISVTDARLKTVGNGGHVEDAQGDDIRPYTDAGLTTAITGYEKVFYDGTNGILEMWVKRASVADGLVTYLAYGDASITTDGSSTTTWSNSFLGVYHFADGTTLNVNSATGSNNGTNTNGVTATSGKIDGGANFASASSQYVNLSNGMNPTSLTYSAWINGTTFPNAYNTIFGRHGSSTNYTQIHVKSTGKLAAFFYGSGDHSYDGTGVATLSAGTNYYIVSSYYEASPNTFVTYVNASVDKTLGGGAALATTATNTNIGRDPDSGAAFFNGKIDEARVASVGRSANWITTEYNNQNAPGTFMVLGTEVPIVAATNTGAFFPFFQP